VIKRDAGQQRHDKERLLLPGFLELARLQNVNDVGMAQAGKDAPLFLEKRKRSGIDTSPDSFQSNVTPGDRVISLVNDTHAALANGRVFDFISAADHKKAGLGLEPMHRSLPAQTLVPVPMIQEGSIVTQPQRLTIP